LLFLPKRKPKTSDESKWINKLFKLFEKQKISRIENETLQQFSRRINSQLTPLAANALRLIVNEYYEWKYTKIQQKTTFEALSVRLHKHVMILQSQFTGK
jgi:hypothetical protein